MALTHVKSNALKSSSFNNIFQELPMDLSRKLVTYLKKKKVKAGEIAQLVKCSLHVKTWVQSPSTQVKSQLTGDVVAHTCSSHAEGGGARRILRTG